MKKMMMIGGVVLVALCGSFFRPALSAEADAGKKGAVLRPSEASLLLQALYAEFRAQACWRQMLNRSGRDTARIDQIVKVRQRHIYILETLCKDYLVVNETLASEQAHPETESTGDRAVALERQLADFYEASIGQVSNNDLKFVFTGLRNESRNLLRDILSRPDFSAQPPAD